MKFKPIRIFIAVSFALFFGKTPLNAYSACEGQIAGSFFNRKQLEEAFVLNEISQNSWSLINTDLTKRKSEIRQLVETYAKEETRASPPKTSEDKQNIRAKALDKALFQVLNDVLSHYQLSGGSDVSRRVYNHLKDRQRARLVACFGQYFSDKPPAEKKQAPIIQRNPDSLEVLNQKREARIYAYDLQPLFTKYKVQQQTLGSEKSGEAHQSIFENYVLPRLIQHTNK